MKNSVSIKGSIKNQFKNPPIRRKKTGGRSTIKDVKKKIFTLLLVMALVFSIPKVFSIGSDSLITPKNPEIPCTWQICSIDTMKTSRDKARENLNNLSYDAEIQKQLNAVKETGANYVAIDTPYDSEFLPYLKRWVKYSRETGLKVWFRGNFSNWEGWFDYPKNMSPDDHIQKITGFIASNPDLFESDDIFDPCPECENAGFWPQPEKDKDYRQFVETQQQQTEQAFRKINKWVIVRQSVIGGRAKDVLDQNSLDALNNIISIDHYVKKPENMTEYINYFRKLNTKTLVSEFGVPIPDMNGDMTPEEQAGFVKQILEVLYQNRDNTLGINYWVLSHGTTAIVDDNYKEKPVLSVLKQYFSPALIRGTVTNTLGEGVKDVTLKTSDGVTHVQTDETGQFMISIPPRKFDLILDDPDFPQQTVSLEPTQSGQIIDSNFTVEPKNPGLGYELRLFFKKTFQNN